MDLIGEKSVGKPIPKTKASKPKNLFSSSSSDEDELDRELTLVASRERAKNPHAEQGRARQSLANRTEVRKQGFDEKSESHTDSSDEDAEVNSGAEQSDHAPSPKDKVRKVVIESDLGDTNSIHINKEYAINYEQVKRKQELQRLTEKYGDQLASMKNSRNAQDSDSDSDDDDDDGILLTGENELAFAKALLAIRKANLHSGAPKVDKNPECGEKKNSSDGTDASKRPEGKSGALQEISGREILQESFFPPSEEQIKRNNEVLLARLEERKKKRKAKFTLADEYRRAIHLTAEDASKGGEGDETAAHEDNSSGLRKLKPQTAEERAIRDSFLKSVSESTEAFSVSKKARAHNVNNDAHLEKDKEKLLIEERNNLLAEAFDLVDDHNDSTKSSSGETTEEEHELEGGDKAQAETTKLQSESKKSQRKKQIQEERFLRDFFMRELWRPESNSGGDGENIEENESRKGNAAVLAELAQAEEDENFYNEAELWEREYQAEKYRHEEDGVYIETFPRSIGDAAEGLLRKPNTSRKDARQRRRERIEAAKAQRVEELKRLKHLKRLEIDERRALIAAVAGLTSKKDLSQSQGESNPNIGFTQKSDEGEDKTLQKLMSIWTDEALNAPFDPADFDKKMQQLFSDEYYEESNMDEEVAYLDAELDNETVLDLPDNDTDTPQNDGMHEGSSKEDTAPFKHQAAFQDLFREPDLFHAKSLEDAKRIAQQHGEPEATDLKPEEQDPLLRELNSIDPGGLNEGSVDLLYPSASSRQQGESSVKKNKKISKATSKDGNSDDENEALLSRLKEELNQKEEEYNQLHYESKIGGGDIATRFRYREVPAEDFTLSIEEILCRDDRQLNMVAPMNCYAAYLDKKSNERDRRKIEWRCKKGFREIEPNRSSRHYGDVSRTIVLDPNMPEEEGMKVVEQLRKRLRDEDGEVEDNKVAQTRGEGRGRYLQAGRANGRGRGSYMPNPSHGASKSNDPDRKQNSFYREDRGKGRGGFAHRSHSRFDGPSSRGRRK